MVKTSERTGNPGSARRRRAGSRLAWRIVVSGIALAVALIALTAWNAVASRRNAYDAAWHETASLSLAIAEQTSRTFQSVDIVLRNSSEKIRAAGVATADGLATAMASPAAHAMLADQVVGLRQVDALTVIGADGHLVNSSRSGPLPMINAVDRDFYRVLRDTPGTTTYIGQPVQGGATSAWLIFMARRLNAPDGTFIGVLTAIIQLNYFEDFFRSVGEDSGYGVSLRRNDGTLLARYPREAHDIGDTRSDPQMFGEVRTGSAVAQSISVSRVDGISRLRTVRALHDFPLAIVVSRNETDITAEWWRQSLAVGGGPVIGALALVIATLLLGRQVARRELSDAIMAAALEHMGDGIMMIDGDGKVQVCNRHAVAMLELPAEPVGAHLQLDSVETVENYEHRGSNGSILEVHSNPLPDGGVVRTYRDVTAYRAREAALSAALERSDAAEADLRRHRDDLERQVASRTHALAASEARLVAAIAAIPEGIVLFDADDRLVLCNAAYRELYGLTEGLARPGSTFSELVRVIAERGTYALNGESVDDHVRQRVARHRAVARFEADCYEQNLSDGRSIEVSEQRTADGGIVGLRIDVTKARQRETVEREREKLAALGQLAGGVAHEINNLLQPVLTFPEIVMSRLPPDDLDSREDLELMQSSGRKARDIVRGILLFARKEDPVLTPVSLAAETHSALNFVRDLVPPGIALVEQGLEGSTAQAAINKTQLVQVLTNLIVNAAHAMRDHGTVTIALDAVSPDESEAAALGLAVERRYLTLAITDTGHGMDAQTLKRLFEPFFTTKPVGQGTGLGLPVVYGILKSWEGAIAVDSISGKGTTFTLYVPEAAAAAEVVRPMAALVPA